MGKKTDEARSLSLKILKEINNEGKYAHISLKEHIKKSRLDKRDIGFVTQLVYGTLEKQITIDWILKKFSRLKKRINPWVLNILRLGCYQILYMDRVPDSAACNESVELCKNYGFQPLQGLINGVLRNISRNKHSIKFPSEETDLVSYLSLTYSYPEWLVEKWIKEYGIKAAKSILSPLPQDNFITIRVNCMKTEIEQLQASLRQYGIKYEKAAYMDGALKIRGVEDIDNNPKYKDGSFTVQGESSMLVTHILDPKKNELILDSCSAPGGKAIYIAERMEMQGKIIAWDIHPHRIDLINYNIHRMGANIIQPQLQDARNFVPEFEGKLDRILIDAPCSGLGVIHKKPDIKTRIKQESLQELTNIQQNILSTCSKYLKYNGVLVYSTCTINPNENEKIIERFLQEHKEFMLDDISNYLPMSLVRFVEKKGMIQLIPSRDGIDGFFICRLRKKGRI